MKVPSQDQAKYETARAYPSVPSSPVEAIFADTDVPPAEAQWVDLNANRSRQLPVIAAKEVLLATAEERARVGLRLRSGVRVGARQGGPHHPNEKGAPLLPRAGPVVLNAQQYEL